MVEARSPPQFDCGCARARPKPKRKPNSRPKPKSKAVVHAVEDGPDEADEESDSSGDEYSLCASAAEVAAAERIVFDGYMAIRHPFGSQSDIYFFIDYEAVGGVERREGLFPYTLVNSLFQESTGLHSRVLSDTADSSSDDEPELEDVSDAPRGFRYHRFVRTADVQPDEHRVVFVLVAAADSESELPPASASEVELGPDCEPGADAQPAPEDSTLPLGDAGWTAGETGWKDLRAGSTTDMPPLLDNWFFLFGSKIVCGYAIVPLATGTICRTRVETAAIASVRGCVATDVDGKTYQLGVVRRDFKDFLLQNSLYCGVEPLLQCVVARREVDFHVAPEVNWGGQSRRVAGCADDSLPASQRYVICVPAAVDSMIAANTVSQSPPLRPGNQRRRRRRAANIQRRTLASAGECSICSETMTIERRPIVLDRCGHIFARRALVGGLITAAATAARSAAELSLTRLSWKPITARRHVRLSATCLRGFSASCSCGHRGEGSL